MNKFIGRKKELEELSSLLSKKSPSLIVVKGRRRIGKSRLIKEFSLKNPQRKLFNFSGLAPQEGISSQDQRDHFAKQLASFAQIPPLTFNDWSDAFNHLDLYLKPNDLILFDEISWMGSKDPSFIPKLKVWWDKQTKPIITFLCGSVSTWIEENILKSTAFFGRINLIISLEPLSIPESFLFLKKNEFKGSDYDIYKILSIIGGIPWYLEQVTSGLTANQIIKNLCFRKNGILVTEFDRIFHDLFNNKGEIYKKIINTLKDGKKTLAEIRESINFSHSGTLSMLTNQLIIAGFLQKQYLWAFKTRQISKQSLFYIFDPYLRFYLKVIEPNLNKINLNEFNDFSISNLPSFDAHIGIQLEYLLLQNRNLLLKAMGLSTNNIIFDGPYRQTKTIKHPGCQIDYLVQTHTKNLFVCEFKFKRKEIGKEIIDEMQKKISSLQIPKGFAAIPVLFHIGGVSSSLETSDYFYRVIDISDFLEKK